MHRAKGPTPPFSYPRWSLTMPTNDDDLLETAIPIPHEEGDDLDELAPIEADDVLGGDHDDNAAKAKIRQFAQRKIHEEHWNRTPNTTGAGAIHVKTFVTKLRLEAVEHLDEQVNQWLDAHPEYEVKFVTTTIGRLIGKNTEDALFMSVWV